MKHVVLLALGFGLAVFTACTKEETNTQGTTGIYVDSSSADNPQCGHSCGSSSSYDEPLAIFTIDNPNGSVNEQETLKINNQSANIVAYEWDFGNGDKSTQTNPVYQYKIHGNYTVRLKATDARGGVHTLSRDVLVLCLYGGGTHDE
ncbi:MAG: PKD domain-containing protein [Saprospiraceae bacterium]|nr:PKD domain-containing protein [Saprospiraceae bacterium]